MNSAGVQIVLRLEFPLRQISASVTDIFPVSASGPAIASSGKLPRPPFISTLNAIGTRGRRGGVSVSISSPESHHEPTSYCACFHRGACNASTRNAGCGARPSSSGPPEVRTEAEPGRKDPDQRPLLAPLPLLNVRRQHLRVRLLAFGGEELESLMTRFAGYVWLRGLLRPIGRRQSLGHPTSGLWLIPWHVPPLS
jgi:hypothetical protein